ncbi:MAG: rod shape-determining protein MreC [Desulfomonile tiedjei]|uniref:Cell shape-determining protein MreC n=1 Tax=Desulfomonile tiedjei TaxID=2358 RepID=A0A9D6V4I1_9BACT|nr:rod shape-determining protein MreC [Desulfomonile tiedjei]
MPRAVRDIAIVLILIGGGLIILFSSPQEPQSGPVTRAVYSVIRPFQQAVFSMNSRLKGSWNTYISLVNVQEKNRLLEEEIRKFRQENASLLNKDIENRRLKKLLQLKSRNEFPMLVAQVVGEDALGWYRTFFINRGSDDGVAPEMPVVVSEGVVGRIAKTSTDISRVLLLTDPNLALDCRVIRTRDRGVLNGSLERGCTLRYIGLSSDVKPGDQVITSGLDGIFPRGLAVGTVETVRKAAQGLFLEAQIRPAVNFLEIEEVLVILAHKAGFDVRPGLEDKR